MIDRLGDNVPCLVRRGSVRGLHALVDEREIRQF